MTENNSKSIDLEIAYKAIASLASRVTQLEQGIPAGAVSGDGSSVAMTATLADLKLLRVTLLTCCTEAEEQMKELESVKKENGKLKYRIKHLLRSLEAEER